MSDKYKIRSIPDKENYATYLALPLLELSKYSFGEGNFMNSYLTANGQIAVLVKDLDKVGWNFWEHSAYRTDLPYYDGVLVLFKCPERFEEDIRNLLSSKFSKLSSTAMQHIENYSGLPVDFKQKDGIIKSHRLILAIRMDKLLKAQLSEELNATISEELEIEPALREQDILHDVDTDISFIYEEYQ